MTPIKKKKVETKQQRVKKHAEAIFARCMAALTDHIVKAPPAEIQKLFPPQKIKEMIHNRINFSIDAAGYFDDAWEAQKGRFIEENEN